MDGETLSKVTGNPSIYEDQDKYRYTVDQVAKELREYVPLHRSRQVILNRQKR